MVKIVMIVVRVDCSVVGMSDGIVVMFAAVLQA